ncbi:MAG TPA: kinase/pyrophosphorylase [Rhodospirillales bacterium]|jgi:hypothetical protein|nr:kinase/pyrophosphorylase [Rhodospirillales bacterium]|tara:strand:- start:950 stop:1201 length:252 start_codon:yes stop_codon:yes gene_type:complete
MKVFHLHLVSDSTGETVSTATHASLVHFEDIQSQEHIGRMIQDNNQMKEVIAGIKATNVLIVPGCPLSPELSRATIPLIVGLT